MGIMNWIAARVGFGHGSELAMARQSNAEVRGTMQQLKDELEPLTRARDPMLALWSRTNPHMAGLAHELNEERNIHLGNRHP